ncbi:hypothetical protein KFE25_012024 [Diacronema lutheri]|uniref:Uncharacterized protein n=1 Tax=Diacronema lutheri TaxID=2081491 RepID=A0A8J6C7V8_DIALT|nr:hypothetical protein KFE25_012024 [Diacronema lutheri]
MSCTQQLRELKAEADRLEEAGDLAGASDKLRAALALLMPAGVTHAVVPAGAQHADAEEAALVGHMAAVLGHELAQLEIEQGHFASAAEVSRAAVAASPDFAHAHATLGSALVELHEHAAARTAFLQAADLAQQPRERTHWERCAMAAHELHLRVSAAAQRQARPQPPEVAPRTPAVVSAPIRTLVALFVAAWRWWAAIVGQVAPSFCRRHLGVLAPRVPSGGAALLDGALAAAAVDGLASGGRASTGVALQAAMLQAAATRAHQQLQRARALAPSAERPVRPAALPLSLAAHGASDMDGVRLLLRVPLRAAPCALRHLVAALADEIRLSAPGARAPGADARRYARERGAGLVLGADLDTDVLRLLARLVASGAGASAASDGAELCVRARLVWPARAAQAAAGARAAADSGGPGGRAGQEGGGGGGGGDCSRSGVASGNAGDAKSADADADADAGADAEGDADGDAEGDADGDAEGDADGDAECDADGDAEGDADGDAEGDANGDAEGDADGDGECEAGEGGAEADAAELADECARFVRALAQLGAAVGGMGVEHGGVDAEQLAQRLASFACALEALFEHASMPERDEASRAGVTSCEETELRAWERALALAAPLLDGALGTWGLWAPVAALGALAGSACGVVSSAAPGPSAIWLAVLVKRAWELGGAEQLVASVRSARGMAKLHAAVATYAELWRRISPFLGGASLAALHSPL